MKILWSILYTPSFIRPDGLVALNHSVKLPTYQHELQASVAGFVEYVSWHFRPVDCSTGWLAIVHTGWSAIRIAAPTVKCIVRSVDSGINYAANPEPVQCSLIHRPINSENIHEPRNPSGRCVIPEGVRAARRSRSACNWCIFVI